MQLSGLMCRRARRKSVLLPLSLLLLAAAAPCQTLKTLVRFDGSNSARPLAVTQGIDGNFYGMTDGNHRPRYPGIVFRVTSGGSFTSLDTLDRDPPSSNAGLVQATDGNLYGAALNGAYGSGQVFRLTPDGTLTTIYSFCPQAPNNCPDGSDASTLVQADDGYLYGTTSAGGTGGNNGTIFKMTTGGVLTTLHSFDGTDGSYPLGPLTQASDGNFYGLTSEGGANKDPTNGCGIAYGCGTVFKITPQGTFTSLYSFCSQPDCADGETPWVSSGLVQASDGNLYGTTVNGGANGGGVVFRITAEGALTTIYSFSESCTEGCHPWAGLVQATNGSLYGTATDGGPHQRGTIFRITLDGKLRRVYSFCSNSGCSDGGGPDAPLIQATDGRFYGATYGSSGTHLGTVFRLSTGLKPFVTPLIPSGSVGSSVIILGNNLAGATAVTFNGARAPSFTVNATGSAITTTVPTGATTGNIQVTLSTGTLTSNVPFRVSP